MSEVLNMNTNETGAFCPIPEMAGAHWSKRYREDAAFRAGFDRDPNAALAEEIGAAISPDVKVVVHRSQPDELHIVVPADGGLMSAEELGEIAAGRTWDFSAAPMCDGPFAGYPLEKIPDWYQRLYRLGKYGG